MNMEIISDELLSKFMEGKTDGEEEMVILREMESDSKLLDEWLSMAKAAELTDAEPLVQPDYALAEEKIHSALREHSGEKMFVSPRVNYFRPRFYWAVAASVALFATVAFLLLRKPEPSGTYVAQNGEDTVKVVEELSGTELAQLREEQPRQTASSATQKAGESRSEASEAVTINAVWQEAEQVAEVEHVQRVGSQEMNALRMVKPSKSSYAVLCKNLDKSFAFEWTADAVRELLFSVTDAQGRRIASVTDATAEKFSLKYKDIYPERQLTWELNVVFQDGSRETKRGKIQIDYQIQ